MGKSVPSPPPPPDPIKLAEKQGETNLEAALLQARLNRINEVTPFGGSFHVAPGQEGLFGRLPDYALESAPFLRTDGAPTHRRSVPTPVGPYALPGQDAGQGQGAGQWTQVSYLAPEEQANVDRQRALTAAVLGLGQGQVGRIDRALAAPLATDVLPPAPGANGFDAERRRVEEAL